MNGELRTTRELWARYLSDEGITVEQEAKLRETLLTNEETRKELLADDTIHRCLQTLSIPLEADDKFVKGVMTRIVASQHSWQLADPPQPPPIVEAPDRTPAVKQVRVIRRERRRKNGWLRPRSVEPLAAVAALALFFAFGSLFGIVFSHRSQVADQMPAEQPREYPNRAATPRAIPIASEPGVGTLVSTEFGSWDRPRTEGSRLRPGPFRLERGEAEIKLDSGTLVRLVGPAELELDSPSQLAIHRGTLAAVVPRSAGEVRLRTPTSNVIGEIATLELVVNQNGASDVLVHDGAVTVEPWATSAKGKPLRLTSTDVNRATVWQPSDTDSRSPLAVTSQSVGGKFFGLINVNGRELDFASPEAFEAVRQRVEIQFRDSVEQLERDWASAVRLYGSGRATGEVSLNGVRMGFENLDDVIQLQRKLAEATAQQHSNSNVAEAGSFQGMININGEVRKFSSVEEFEKAQQEVFGPLQTLDIGGLDMRNLRDVFKAAPKPKQPADNPFLPRNDKPADEFNLPAKNSLRL
jgi:hypothetical protein